MSPQFSEFIFTPDEHTCGGPRKIPGARRRLDLLDPAHSLWWQMHDPIVVAGDRHTDRLRGNGPVT
ncbi:hypothetical protein AQI95_40675 [Streptomyces yokosukanensis]|uniref:Uncharacterized protein n=1 Tax=Streptomyces yokosukanensis TaxID=67386 RepID=A0A101NTQ6_9ACTN|nr:hypothetical protein AQI95_40675 [Streptomyces yokosukanensis]